MDEEVWKEIQWFEWRYFVSNLWNVKSIWGKLKVNIVLKKSLTTTWYEQVNMYKKWIGKTYRVHRLVWQAFLWLDMSDSKIFVCHKDDNPLNNRLDNLFLWTCKDNIRDMINKGRLVKHWNKWEKHPRAKLTYKNVEEIRYRYANEEITQTELAKIYWVSQVMIWCVVRNDNWNEGNF